ARSDESTTRGFENVKNVMRMNHSTHGHVVAFELRLCLAILIGGLLLVSYPFQPEAQQARTELTSTIPVPAKWRPSLEQVQEEVEAGIAAQPQQSQHALNRASQSLADLVDARLFITYVLLQQK